MEARRFPQNIRSLQHVVEMAIHLISDSLVIRGHYSDFERASFLQFS